jgi:hypothetical protein
LFFCAGAGAPACISGRGRPLNLVVRRHYVVTVTIDLTRKKLREAEFFFALLAGEQAAIMKTHGESGEYYLSAFLNAARAVTFRMQYEAKAAYDAWFPGWKGLLSDDDRALLNFHNEQRRLSVHEGGPDTISITEVIPAWMLTAEMGRRGGVFEVFHMIGTPPPTVQRNYMGFRGLEQERVVESCEKYLALLQRLIRDFDEPSVA